jgi:NAD(P)-dependent dehydrogenase (short-subunit alcohol dehydrogenase family)
MKNTKPTAIVTGAAGAIGTAIARQMAEKGFQVFVVARDESKAQKTAKQIADATGNNEVYPLVIDLSGKSSIQHAADNWNGPLHVLINNASTTPRQREETPEGIEMQFATNVLGYFWMINAFMPFLKMGAPSRIVNVASYWAGDMDIDDLECKHRHYNNDTIYRQSKQAERMLTVAFAERLKGSGITVNAVHPGDVNSKLSNNLGYGGHESPDQGADTPVWAATAPELDGITGKYFERHRESVCRFGQDKELVEKLWNICEEY